MSFPALAEMYMQLSDIYSSDCVIDNSESSLLDIFLSMLFIEGISTISFSL